jgi:2-oxoisovalerate dehydrogenase E1 component alpha subunit
VSAILKSEIESNGSSVQVLKEDGSLLNKKAEPDFSKEDLKKLYYLMVLTRMTDERFLRMQRQGRIGFYLTSTGEEAAHIGSAFAMEEKDWLFLQYREPGAALLRGFSLFRFACQILGNVGDLTKGRQMPCHYAYKEGHILSISSPIGTQIPQAVGFAWAAKIRNDNLASLVYFGDGATSSGDFHVGMNFAGVFKVPVVFFCKNNQLAISLPFEKQTAVSSVALKAQAYGIDGIRVDGNDLLAVIQVTKQAVQKARSGGGPTLIEALTYRIGAHSTSDDPRIYGDESKLEEWKKKDCILRFQKYLESKGIWSLGFEKEVQERAGVEVSKAIEEAEKLSAPSLDTLFEDVYSDLPQQLREQKNELLS